MTSLEMLRNRLLELQVHTKTMVLLKLFSEQSLHFYDLYLQLTLQFTKKQNQILLICFHSILFYKMIK